jgi:hypothetical protein
VINFDEKTGDVTTAPGEIELFRLNGVVYTVPGKARPHLALKYMWMAAKKDELAAQYWLLESVLGEDGYKALMDYEDLTPEQLTQVMELAQSTVIGGLEAGKGGAS